MDDSPHYELAVLPTLKDGDPLELDWIRRMLKEFELDRILGVENTVQILKRSFEVLHREPNVIHLHIPKGAQLTIVGDLHGQLDDLLTILHMRGVPSPTNLFLFNGDFVSPLPLSFPFSHFSHASCPAEIG